MVPEDDGRQTVELEDRYIILPTFVGWTRDTYMDGMAVPVEEGFQYCSDTNPECLDAHSLQSFLASCFPDPA